MRTAIDILTEHFDKNHPHLFYHLENKDMLSGVINDGDSIFEAITEAMKIYAEQALDLASQKTLIKETTAYAKSKKIISVSFDAKADSSPGIVKTISVDRESILKLKELLK